MTVKVGLTRDARHRYFLNGEGPIPSVTTITKALSKDDVLVNWAKRETAACAVRNLDVLARMVADGGSDGAQKWLASIPDYQRDTAGDLGSRVHAQAEAVARGDDVELTADERPFVESYQRWLDQAAPSFIVLEEMVCSTTHGYAGTLDAIAWVDGERWLLDLKTSKGIYPEMGMQLVAYARADFIGRAGDPQRYAIPPVTRYGIVHVRPERTRLVEYTAAEDSWQMFLACLALTKRKGAVEMTEYSKRELAA